MSQGALCVFCNGSIDLRNTRIYSKAIGWVISRPGGMNGTNSFKKEKDLFEYMHLPCMQTKDKGISPDQTTMFGDGL